jgi:glycosyltransferase involved in cell wall biosynthesis
MVKKILFYTDCEVFGGSERMLPILINDSKIRESFEIYFAFRRTEGYEKGVRGKIDPGIKSIKLAIIDPDYLQNVRFFRLIKWDLFHKALSRLSRLPIFVLDVWCITGLLRRIKPDLLHINNGGYPGALSCRAAVVSARIVGVKSIVMVVNNIAVDYQSLRRRIQKPFDRFVARNTSLFITGSKFAGDRLVKVLKIDPTKAKPIWNGVAVPDFKPVNPSKVSGGVNFPVASFIIGMIAQMVVRKGHKVAIEAVEHLVSSHSLKQGDIALVLEGTGPLENDLRAFVLQKKLTEFVFFVGEIENPFNLINYIDVMLLTSVSNEDLPNVISEAMAFGKPIVASDLSGIPEQVIPGKNGFLCPPGDIVAFSESLNCLRVNPSLRDEFGKRSRSIYQERFTSQVSTAKYKLEYDSQV